MKYFVTATLILTGVLSWAADRNEAATICQKMKFDSERNKCVATLGRFEYFDRSAIAVCKSMSMDAEMNSCVEAIGDKTYEPYEIENCNRALIDANKTACMKSAGRAYPAQPPPPPPSSCIDKRSMIYDLQYLDRLVFDGDIYRAHLMISDMISTLQRCP